MSRSETFYLPDGGNISCSTSVIGGQFILSAGNYPAIFMFSMPAETAIALATNIIEQANAKLPEAA